MQPQLLPIQIKPGIVRDSTHYANKGGWWDCNWVRFRNGFPEKMGGWSTDLHETFQGACRSLINWTTNNGINRTGFGTNLKYYILSGGNYGDITPIRRTVTLTNPFTTDGTTTVVVTDTAHGAIQNDFVTFSGSSAVGGIPADNLNKEHKITEIINANSYKIVVSTAATSSTTGGGTVTAVYQINTGLDTYVPGVGWGAGTWGRNGWGTASNTPTVGTQIGLWSNALFGEDLIINQRGGGIYYWSASTPNDRAINITSLPYASNAPTIATEVLVSDVDRHVIALGCNQLGESDQDFLNVRWSDTESAANWTPDPTNTAGGFRLSNGTRIVTGLRTRQEVLVWTDSAIYSMQYIGAPYVFNLNLLSGYTNISGPKAKIVVNDVVYWMGRDQFYIYNGRVSVLPCPVRDYIFSRLNIDQIEKVYAASNVAYNEIIWLYPSTNSNENDSYVVFNYVENVWYFGSISRTAWLDRTFGQYPTATDPNGNYYYHEFGFDDGSTNPPSAIDAYIESSPIEIAAGNDFMFVRHAIPDLTFRSSTATSPVVTFIMEAQQQPGGPYSGEQSKNVTKTGSYPVDQFTEKLYTRIRCRSLIFRVESDQTGVGWRIGTPRIMASTDGLRG
jgi:hypothetical protein